MEINREIKRTRERVLSMSEAKRLQPGDVVRLKVTNGDAHPDLGLGQICRGTLLTSAEFDINNPGIAYGTFLTLTVSIRGKEYSLNYEEDIKLIS